MAKKIGTQSYPDKMIDILKDRELLDCLASWAHARQPLAESMILFIRTLMPTDRVYEHFMKEGARFTVFIRVSRREMDEIHRIAREKDWKNPLWRPLIKNMKADFIKSLDKDHVPKFWKSDEFNQYHGEKVKKEIGSTSKVAALLGVKDDAALKGLMVAANMGSDRDMKKYSELVAQNSKSDKKTLMSKLKKIVGF